MHNDIIKWKHFPHYWPFVRGILRCGQWRRTLMFSLICARTNSWANNGYAIDLRLPRAHCDVTVMDLKWYYYVHDNLTMVIIRIAGRAHLRQSVLRLEEALRLQLSSKLISRAAPLAAVLRRAHSRWVVPLSGNTVRCRYNELDFLQNLHKRHPTARPPGRAMGCPLWIQVWFIFYFRLCNDVYNIML